MIFNKVKKKLNISIFIYFSLAVLTTSILVILIIWRRVRIQIRNFLYPLRTQFPHTPSDFAVEQWESVRFQSSDGLCLSGWYIPSNPKSDGGTLIFIHGHSQNRGELLAEAAMLTSHGYGVLLFDLRNSGESEGIITTGYREVEGCKGHCKLSTQSIRSKPLSDWINRTLIRGRNCHSSSSSHTRSACCSRISYFY